jgi:hypothetical protein
MLLIQCGRGGDDGGVASDDKSRENVLHHLIVNLGSDEIPSLDSAGVTDHVMLRPLSAS